mgnify:CR=1 FL=1
MSTGEDDSDLSTDAVPEPLGLTSGSVREVPMIKLLDRVCQVVMDTAVICDNKNLAKGDQAEQYIHNLGIDAGLYAKTELIKLQFKVWAGADEAMYYGYWIAARIFWSLHRHLPHQNSHSIAKQGYPQQPPKPKKHWCHRTTLLEK